MTSQLFKKIHLLTGLITLGSLAVFVKLTKDILAASTISGLDQWVYNHITLVRSEALTYICLFITNLFSPINVLLLTIVLLLSLLAKRKWEHAYILVFSMLGGLIVETLIKMIIERARPLGALVTEHTYSFPTGHATMATIFLALLIYAYKDEIKNYLLRRIFISCAAMLFVIVSFTRIYLGVHWASDVIAGMALGIFWITLLVNATRILNHFQKKKSLVTRV